MKRFRSPASLWAVGLLTSLLLAGCGKPDAPALLAQGQAFEARGDTQAAQIQYRAAIQADPQLYAARMAFGRSLLVSGDADGALVELGRVVAGAPATPGIYELYARAVILSSNSKRAVQILTELAPTRPEDTAIVRAQLAYMWDSLGDRKRSEEALDAALAADPKSPLALTYRARHAWSQGRTEDASRYIAVALEANPSNADALHFRGYLQRSQGDKPAAVASWKAALAADPMHVAAHDSLIVSSIVDGDAAGARRQLTEFSARVPWHPGVRLAEARVLFAEGALEQSRERVLKLLSAAPEHPALLALAGSLEARIGSPVQAVSHLRKLLAAHPDWDTSRLELAQLEFRLGQVADAEKTLRPMLEPDRTTPKALALASEIEFQQGNLKRADALLQRAAEAAPGDSRLQTTRIVRRMKLGEVDQPLAELERLSSESPDSYAGEALFIAKLTLGDLDGAEKALDRLESRQPNRARLAELRARIHLQRQDLARARTEFERAAKLDPEAFGPVVALVRLDQLEDQPAQAVTRVREVIRKNPSHTAALVLLSELLMRGEPAFDEAVALLKQAIASSEGSAEPRLRLIELYLSRRQFKSALETARAALASVPNDERLLDAVARAQLQAGDVEQAASTYRTLAGLMPKSAAPLAQLARVYGMLGRRDAALTTFKRAIELEPTNEAVQRGYVDLLLAASQRAEAIDHLQRLRRSRPNDPTSYTLLAAVHERSKDVAAASAALRDGLRQTNQPELAGRLFTLLMRNRQGAEADAFAADWMKRNPGDLSFEYLIAEREIVTGRFKAAQDRLQRVVQRYPGNVLALNNLAWVTAQLGGGDAVKFARRALSISPERPDLLDTLAFALSSEGKHADAMAVQRRAVSLAPEAAVFRLGLARVAIAAGDKATAREELVALKKMDAAFGASQPVKELEAKL